MSGDVDDLRAWHGLTFSSALMLLRRAGLRFTTIYTLTPTEIESVAHGIRAALPPYRPPCPMCLQPKPNPRQK